MPWELLGEPDPDTERAERIRVEQEFAAKQAFMLQEFKASGETPEQVLERFGVIGGREAEHGGN